MNVNRFFLLSSEKGQTVVEYILLLVVAMAITISFLNYIKVNYLGDPKNCQTTSRNKILCQMLRAVAPTSLEGEGREQFRYFRLRK